MSDQMAVDHAHDSEAQRLMNAARSAIDTLLSTECANRRLSPADTSTLLDARGLLVKAARHIEAVWD
jgi:hypothetical protein